MSDKELRKIYPYWLYIEPIANELLMHIYNEFGRTNESDYSRIFKSYVSPYFYTWDTFRCCMNNDVDYPPVLLCLYAEKNGIKPNKPLIVMRQIAWLLKDNLKA